MEDFSRQPIQAATFQQRRPAGPAVVRNGTILLAQEDGSHLSRWRFDDVVPLRVRRRKQSQPDVLGHQRYHDVPFPTAGGQAATKRFVRSQSSQHRT
jgi:hypothetical protein